MLSSENTTTKISVSETEILDQIDLYVKTNNKFSNSLQFTKEFLLLKKKRKLRR